MPGEGQLSARDVAAAATSVANVRSSAQTRAVERARMVRLIDPRGRNLRSRGRALDGPTGRLAIRPADPHGPREAAETSAAPIGP